MGTPFAPALPIDHVGVKAREQSALMIIDRMKKIAGRMPTIITGDFNSTPIDVAYKIMTAPESGFADTRLLAKEKSGVSWSFHDFGRTPMADRSLIDFVFVKGIREVSAFSIPFVEQQSRYLLDHNPVVLTLVMP